MHTNNKIIYDAVIRKTIENNKAANYYVCSCYLRKIWMNNLICDCSTRGLKSIPRDCPGNTTQLSMTGNNLYLLDNDAFIHFPKLQYLNGLLLMFNFLNKSNLVNGVCPVFEMLQFSTIRYCSLGKLINASLSNKCRLFPVMISSF
jgi:hypothetical protein